MKTTSKRTADVIAWAKRWREQWCACDSTHCESQPTSRLDLDGVNVIDALLTEPTTTRDTAKRGAE